MEIRWTHLKFPRVLAGSEDFFAGLQHPDSPVQIRSAPLLKTGGNAEQPAFLPVLLNTKIRSLLNKNAPQYAHSRGAPFAGQRTAIL